jgi:predicted nucleotidyltransferase
MLRAMCSTPHTSELVAALRSALQGRTEIRLALLFGSQARGQAQDDSDVDLAVDAPGVDTLTLAAELGQAVGRDVQIVALCDAGHALMKALLRDAILLHQGEPGTAGAWQLRMLTLVELDGPFHDRMNRAFLKRIREKGLGRG